MLQSLYTSAVVDHIIQDRVQAAAQARRAPLRRRFFGRGGRGARAMHAPHAWLRVRHAGR